MSKSKIPVPTIEEQNLIIEKAETLKQQKENLENVYLKKIENLEELKKSVLQKAFCGELSMVNDKLLMVNKARSNNLSLTTNH